MDKSKRWTGWTATVLICPKPLGDRVGAEVVVCFQHRKNPELVPVLHPRFGNRELETCLPAVEMCEARVGR
jgi:hypothetical protein